MAGNLPQNVVREPRAVARWLDGMGTTYYFFWSKREFGLLEFLILVITSIEDIPM
jgi:hypothetical protein